MNRFKYFMIALLGMTIIIVVYSQEYFSQKRLFIFPSEIILLPDTQGEKYQVVGMVSNLINSGYQAEFFLSDQDTKVKVTYGGPIPDLMTNDMPVAVAGIWKDGNLVADTIWAKFTNDYLTEAELIELKSYGFSVQN